MFETVERPLYLTGLYYRSTGLDYLRLQYIFVPSILWSVFEKSSLEAMQGSTLILNRCYQIINPFSEQVLVVLPSTQFLDESDQVCG
jgi:hypothetical protein